MRGGLAADIAGVKMRQVASVAFGLWYAVIAWYAFAFGINEIPRLSGAQGHLVLDRQFTWLLGVAWLISVLIGCLLAAESSWERPVRSAFLTGLLLAIPVYLFTVVSFFSRAAYVVVVLTPFVGLVSGQMINEQRPGKTQLLEGTSSSLGNEAFTIYGIGWKSWLWLWVPIYWWLYFIPAILYYTWLNAALDWHRAFQPSLWFDSGWDFFAGLADLLTGAALFTLIFGAGFALISLSAPGSPASPGTMLKKFLGWGVGLAMVATLIFLSFAANLTNHLISVSTQHRPWWQFF